MTETAELTGGAFGDVLGYSVGISGNTVVAGAPRWPAYDRPGAVYLFVEPRSGWKSTSKCNAKLTASDGAANDYFGFSVAISGQTVVSGAYGATISINSQQGAAYVFGGPHLLDAPSPLPLAAQERQQEHTRYKLVDLGTFGGPQSYFNLPGQELTAEGIVAGYADTSTPDPFPTACFNPDCFVSRAFQWENGVLTDLGALTAGWSSSPVWISDTGLIAGVSQNAVIDPLIGIPEIRAVLWKDGKIIDLGTLGGNESIAVDVNNRGQVVGGANNAIPDPFSFGGGTQTRAFLWQNGVLQDLGTLGGPDAFATGVNELGQVAGNSYTSYTPTSSGIPQNNSFLWQNGKMIDLGTLGGTSGFPNALNNLGQVVGQSNVSADAFFRPFLWYRGTLTDLGTFLGPGPPSYGAANWINDAGEIVGWADNQYSDFPALWKDGVIHNLGTVAGDSCAYAVSINSQGQAVGGSGICGVTRVHAFLWENGSSAIDLNTLVPSGSGVHLTNAVSINDRGEIASEGLLPNGDQHTFLLIPCGEGDAGCRDSAAGTAATTQSSQAPATQPRATASPALSDGPNGMLDRFRARRFPGRRSLGPANAPTR